MEGFQKAIRLFPLELRERLTALPTAQQRLVQDIRLRAGQPVVLSVAGRGIQLSIVCSREWIAGIFDTACDRSVYAHQEELRRGFITTSEGCRIGVAGTAVVQEGEIVTYRHITSLCVRVARKHIGCAAEIAEVVISNERVRSILLCGEPACGKTSLLKDLIREFSLRGISAAVVDERGELAENGQAVGADVLLYTPKAAGVEQAIRCLSPHVILLDELGDESEIRAVMDGVYRGVPTIATVHCGTPQQLLQRKGLREALENGGFEYLCFLKGRRAPGEVGTIVKTEDWLYEMVGSRTDGDLWRRDRVDELLATATPTKNVAPMYLCNTSTGRSHPLCGNSLGDHPL